MKQALLSRYKFHVFTVEEVVRRLNVEVLNWQLGICFGLMVLLKLSKVSESRPAPAVSPQC